MRSAVLALACSLAVACVCLPPITPAVPSYAVTPDPSSRLGGAIRQRGDDPRAVLIEESNFALTSRLDLIEGADAGIDLQYFIWQNDPTGILVIRKILAAADRGVRIRALMDDIQLEGLVSRLHALDAHPNIEIRIFNPFSLRLRFRLWLFRLAEFAIDGVRLNHRMHNKLLLADNQLAILGGRNIGDDYFGRSRERTFIDTDILLSGDVVRSLSNGFDRYWNSRWAYPIGALADLTVIPDDLSKLRQRIDRRLREHSDLVALSDSASHLHTIDEWSRGSVLKSTVAVVDDPNVSWIGRPDDIAAHLAEVALTARREVLVVTPYLIPTSNLLDIAETLIANGVKIRVVTNSLATNDVVIAQAAYSKSRKRLIRMGVELHEMQHQPAMQAEPFSKDISLHSKYIVVDEETVFVGSMNLDPRSLYINTELGVVLRSTSLAATLRSSFEALAHPSNSWRLVESDDGLEWHSSTQVLTRSPAKSTWQRVRHRLLRLLPFTTQI